MIIGIAFIFKSATAEKMKEAVGPTFRSLAFRGLVAYAFTGFSVGVPFF
jgi:hypothetical protein